MRYRMKLKYFLLCLICLSNYCFGQSDFITNISLDKMNVIYVGVDNPITLSTNRPSSEIECTLDNNGLLKKISYSMYSIRVNSEGNYSLKIKSNSENLINTHFLRAKYLPTPIPKLLTQTGDSISITNLLTAKKLELTYVPEIDFYVEANILSFNILKISKSNIRTEISNQSDLFSAETNNFINTVMPGDILIFRNIIGKDVTKKVLKIPDLILYIY